MALSDTIFSAVETIFTVFEEIVVLAEYIDRFDDGFGSETDNIVSIRTIAPSLTQKDLQTISFSDQIQPTDTVIIVPGKDLGSTKVETGKDIRFGSENISIVAFDVDPYKAAYTMLLRN